MPFSSGVAPGIDAGFLNNMETMLAAGWFDSLITSDHAGGLSIVNLILTHGIQINDGAATNGTTAGTCTKYAICLGQFKAYLFYFNGYRNSTATEQRITLDTAFTSRVLWLSGNIPTASPWNGGSQVSSASGAVDALSSSGGSGTGYTSFHPRDFGEVTNAMDQLGLGVSQGSTTTGCLLLIGV